MKALAAKYNANEREQRKYTRINDGDFYSYQNSIVIPAHAGIQRLKGLRTKVTGFPIKALGNDIFILNLRFEPGYDFSAHAEYNQLAINI